MNKERLTKTLVDRLAPDETEYVAWCGKLAGFGCRVWPSGKKVFIVFYRAGGRGSKLRKKSIGTYGMVTVEQARREAEKYLASAQLGQDLVGEERKAKAEMTVSDLCDEYLEHGVSLKKPSTIATDIGRINGHIRPLLGKKKLSAVTRTDIERFLNDVAKGKTAQDKRTGKKGRSIIKGGKGTAARTVRLLGGIFTYAVNQGYIDSNPRLGVKIFKDRSMDRFLTETEMDRLGEALIEAETIGLPWQLKDGSKSNDDQRVIMSPHVTGAIRLLILTGCRLREILHLKWSEVDFERLILNLPDSKTGRKTVYLSVGAVEVLNALPRIGTYVVLGRDPDQPRSDLKRPWKRIADHAGLEGVRLHDLRHTFASQGAASGMSLQMIGALLGHKSPETTARYAHLTDDPLRRALNEMSGAIKNAVVPQ
ncbi:MAG: tyrosine-type recombinase/integrase [Rhizobiaceae bacterium]|nr:tyrosine-type recombinase/integrase [Rhizobiaceae bacterium]